MSSSRKDIFISYAHLDGDFVEADLHPRLMRCRKQSDGKRPRIFLDNDREHGIRPGFNFQSELISAVKSCEKFLPVFSEQYFQSDFCNVEIFHAYNRDPAGRKGILIPLLYRACDIPDVFELHQHISIRSYPDWFERLCDALELIPDTEKLHLEFLSQPATVRVNESLPEIRICVRDEHGRTKQVEDAVTVTTEKGELQGETTLSTCKGVVEFHGLSISQPVERTRLIIQAEGQEPIFSEWFDVNESVERVEEVKEVKAVEVEVPVTQPTAPPEPVIPAQGRPVFFHNGTALALIGTREIHAYALPHKTPMLSAPIALQGRIRQVKQGAGALVVTDWKGMLIVLRPNIQPGIWNFHDPSVRAETVIGDIAFHQDEIFLGLWSGGVYRVASDQTLTGLFTHPSGVQALAAVGSGISLVDLDGRLSIYDQGKLIRQEMLEPRVYLLKRYPQYLIAVGKRRLYQIPLNGSATQTAATLIDNTSKVFAESHYPVLINAQGRGTRIDEEFRPQVNFHTAPGAVPVSADERGRWCVFANPDGSHTLLMRPQAGLQGQIVHSHKAPMAIDSSGTQLAVSEPDGIRLMAPEELVLSRDNP